MIQFFAGISTSDVTMQLVSLICQILLESYENRTINCSYWVMLANIHQKKSDIEKLYILGRPNPPLNLTVILEGIE